MKKQLLCLLGVLMIVGLAAAGYAAPPLLGHWDFDEGSGTIAHDKGPNHYDGTLSPGGASWADGIAGKAISLDAANGGLVDMGPVLNNLAGTSYTIAAWVKTSIVAESNCVVVASHNAYLAAGYILGINTSGSGAYGQSKKAWFYNLGTGEVSPFSSLTVVDGTWHHLVGVRDAAQGIVSLYVDGMLQDSYADQGLGNAQSGIPLLFGAVRDYQLLKYLYTGLIDDVQIYGAALTDRDIVFLFENPGRAVPIPSPGVNFLLLGLD
jgi:hypothetical protein